MPNENQKPEAITEPTPSGSVEQLVSCLVCQTPTYISNLTHLKIYVAECEGVDVCLTCRQTLTEVLRGMMRTNYAGRKQGYLAAKQVAAAKAANSGI